jgi:hypothetical protein
LNTVNKEFNITKGTIVWNGNPYNATVDITASYPTRAAFFDLLSETLTSSEEIISAKKLVPVNVEMKASGSLIKPAINFDLLTPNTNGNSQVNFLALQKLQKIKEDQNELNNQVFGLMVLNRFLPTSNTTDASNPFNSVYKNTLTELASIQVSKRINDAFYRITKDDKTQINLNYRLYDAATDIRNYNEWNVNVSRRFFNDRLTIDGGFVYDYGKTETTNNTNLAGDFLVEYKLTLDGRVKLKGFKKTEYDILSERNKNRTGLGLSYRREFNTFEELWNAVLKKNKRAI